jgi:hypothetical protein
LSEVTTGLDISKIIERFDADVKKCRDGVPIPVTCTDEFTALRIATQLKTRCVSIFPLASRRVAQIDSASRDLPQYYASIAIKRVDETKTFYFFLLDALSQFLSTEVETTANSWAELSAEVTHIAAASLGEERDYPSRWAEAWEWIQYVMHLDRESIASYNDANRLPWQPILRRARQIVRQNFAEMDELLERQVEHAMKKDGDDEPPRTAIEKLETVFDVTFPKGEYDFAKGKPTRAEVIKRLRERLKVNDMLPLVSS